MADEIVKGDVVQLKSGGPHMTAQEVNDGDVFCRWFDSKNALKDGEFPADMLKKIDPNAPKAMPFVLA